jgi:hypothetical protein
VWEDPVNVDGGKWSIYAEDETWAQRWLEVLLSVIGEQLDFCNDIVRHPTELFDFPDMFDITAVRCCVERAAWRANGERLERRC